MTATLTSYRPRPYSKEAKYRIREWRAKNPEYSQRAAARYLYENRYIFQTAGMDLCSRTESSIYGLIRRIDQHFDNYQRFKPDDVVELVNIGPEFSYSPGFANRYVPQLACLQGQRFQVAGQNRFGVSVIGGIYKLPPTGLRLIEPKPHEGPAA